MVGHAFRIAAFCNACHFFRHHHLLLFYHLEVLDDIDSGVRCYESKSVELVIFEELVGDLDDSLSSVNLAVEVYTYRDLAFDTLEVEDVEGLIYVFCRNMVQYGTIFLCAYY